MLNVEWQIYRLWSRCNSKHLEGQLRLFLFICPFYHMLKRLIPLLPTDGAFPIQTNEKINKPAGLLKRTIRKITLAIYRFNAFIAVIIS